MKAKYLKIDTWKKPQVIYGGFRLLSFTLVGKVSVPVVNAEYATIVTFRSGDLGTFERGDFLFWTAVLKKKHIWTGYTDIWKPRTIGLVLGRARAILPPGDRFDRMKHEMLTDPDANDRKIYREWWKKILGEGKNIKFIRPSTKREVGRWMKGHKSDAKFVTRLVVNGRGMKV